jgi:hypothetical protein
MLLNPKKHGVPLVRIREDTMTSTVECLPQIVQETEVKRFPVSQKQWQNNGRENANETITKAYQRTAKAYPVEAA